MESQARTDGDGSSMDEEKRDLEAPFKTIANIVNASP